MRTAVVEGRLRDDSPPPTEVDAARPRPLRSKLRRDLGRTGVAVLVAATSVLLMALGAALANGSRAPHRVGASSDEVDLSSLLVDLPATKWIAAPNAPSQGIGPFGIEEAAGILSRPLVPEHSVGSRLDEQGFVRGYGRVWAERGTRRLIATQVVEFKTVDNATAFVKWARFGDEASGFAVYDVPLPDGYGFEITPQLMGSTGRAVVYRDGRRLFVVIRGGDEVPSREEVLSIARSQLGKG